MPPTYVYRSEGQHGQATWVATCPEHGRDLTIQGNAGRSNRVADQHDRLFHHA
jgi:hypothetical protein